ncbi:MAG: hypothetical protein AMS24_01815 [Chlamydiae bacterium SM23_39]|nr:MAG: hypothetical protein AMS24_01815 [Chlamydiae bacterium SM23_39]
MKIKKIVFLFILMGCATKYQKEDLVCIQINDRNGFNETVSSKERLKKYEKVNFISSQPYKKVIRIFKENKFGKRISKITSYYENGIINQYLEGVNGRAFGKYKQWYPNGILAVEANIVGGSFELSFFSQKDWIFDGMCKAWDDKGNLISEFKYDKGELEGKAIYYFSNGKIKKILNYLKNNIEGEVLEFKKEGDLKQKSFYSKGKKEGVAKGFWKKDKLAFFEIYQEGDLLKGIYYDKNGEIISKVVDKKGEKAIFSDKGLDRLVEYKEGQPEGRVKIFKKGKLYKIFYMKEGKKHGEEIEYYLQKETPKISIPWIEGVIQGVVKTWYPNFIIQSQKEMAQNKKNGISSAWYEDGHLMLAERYENDFLIEGKYYKKGENEPITEVYDGNGTATLFDEKGNFVKSIKYINRIPQDESF